MPLPIIAGEESPPLPLRPPLTAISAEAARNLDELSICRFHVCVQRSVCKLCVCVYYVCVCVRERERVCVCVYHKANAAVNIHLMRGLPKEYQ